MTPSRFFPRDADPVPEPRKEALQETEWAILLFPRAYSPAFSGLCSLFIDAQNWHE
jgi:hypothetical protein